MADSNAIGFSLKIDDNQLKKLDEIDKKINQIATDSDNMAKVFTSAMTRMGTGADSLLKKLQTMQTTINNLDISKFAQGVQNVGRGTTQVEQFAASIAKAAEAINKYNAENRKRADVDNSKQIGQLNKEIEAMRKRTQQLEEYINKQRQANQGAGRRGGGTSSSTNADTKALNAYNRAMAASEALVTQRINKIAKLRNAEEQLRATGRNYQTQLQRIQQEIARLNSLNEGQVDAYGRVIRSQRNLVNTSQQLTRQLALLFSVSAIEGYISKLVRVRGEFELQQTALASILQNKDQADKLFGQITDLAVKSPFTLKELTTYTKSLSAYQVEYEKLYDTTKMLADVSAGLGVDMQRLILAFGQVKAANILRGCLGYGTPVMLFNGDIKEVQDVVVGDVLINENGEPVNVLELIRGRETMFLVEQVSGHNRTSYRVNRNHILTLWNVQEQRLEDVYVYDYLKNTEAYLGLRIVDGEKVYYDIEVTKDIIDDYYGFVLDGNKRFRLGDGTITHNTEVRQFTEAGLNILGELAKYYSELEGRMISVGEVQEMVTKRMVSFGDVEEVFKRVTSEGGIFYNMQERQAETLAGMMSNLQDRIDLMLNKIGKDNQDIIKSVISFIGDLLENYDAIVAAIQAAGGAFLLYKLNILETNKALIRYAIQQKIVTASTTKQLTLVQLLRVGFLRLTSAIKSAGSAMLSFTKKNAWLIILAAIGTAIYEIVTWNDELNDQLDDINKKYNEQSASLIKVSEAYKEITKRAKEATNAQNSEDIYKEQFAQLQKLDEMLEDRGYRLPINIELVTPENIDEAFAGGQEILQLANEFGAEFQKALAVELNATEGWFNIFGDNLASDLKDLSDSYSQVGGSFKANLDILENEVIVASEKLQGAARGYYEELRKGQKENETDKEWTMRRLTLISDINDLIRISNNSTQSGIQHERLLNQLLSTRTEILENEREVQYELDKVMNDLINKYGGIDNLKKQFNDNPVVIRTEIDRAFEQMELDAQTKRFAAHWAANRLQIPIEFTEPKKTEMPKFFNDWRDTVKALDTGGIFEKQLQSMSGLPDLEKELQKAYKEATEQLEVYNRANTKRLDLTRQIEEAEKKRLSANAEEAEAAQLTIKKLESQRDLIDKEIKAGKEQANTTISEVKTIASAFNLNYRSSTTSGSKKNPELEKLKEQIALIEKAEKEYKEYRELYDETTAQQKTEAAFRQAFEDLGLNVSMDFDVQGVIAQFEKMLSEVGEKVGKKGTNLLNEEIATRKSEVDTEKRTKDIEEYRNQIDELFRSLENYRELEKLGLNKDLISHLFGIDVSSIQDVIDVFEKIKDELKKYGNEGETLIAESEKKITDAQQKELEDRMKKYAQYLKKQYSEIANIRIKLQKEMAEVDTLDMTDVQKESIKQRLQEEANKRIQEQTWEDFKASDMYIQMFDDISTVSTKGLDYMVQRLEELKDTLNELDPSDLKEIIDKINKIEEDQIKRNPLKGLGGDIKDALEFARQRRELEKQMTAEYEKQKTLKEEIPVQEQNVENAKNVYANAVSTFGSGSTQAQAAQGSLSKQEKILANMNKDLSDSKKKASDLKKQYDEGAKAAEKVKKRTEEFANKTNQAVDSMRTLVDGLNSVFDMSDEFNDIASSLMDFGTNMASTISSAGSAFASFATGDIFGGITSSISAIGGLFSSIGALFSIGDKEKQRQIEEEQEKIEDLQHAYEKLEKAIDDAYSIDTLKKATDAALKNLDAQEEAIKKQIALEKDKKHADEDAIKGYQNQLDEIAEQREELAEEMKSTLTGGIFDDILSAAESFTNAWLDAFNETGNGLKGLEENFDELMRTLIIRQVTMKAISPLVDKMAKELEKYVNETDTELTLPEATAFVNFSKPLLGQMSDILTNLFTSFENAGIDIGGDGELSGLQKGIQSITEETAQALEALLNSIRYFVSDTNTTLKNIYNGIFAENSPLYAEMQLQSQYLNNIYNLLSSTSKVTANGRVFKVVIQ